MWSLKSWSMVGKRETKGSPKVKNKFELIFQKL
jgi:hypothetical protein